MLAKKLVNKDFKPLEPSSSVSAALAKMDAWQTSNIPVLEPETQTIIGHVRFDDLAKVVDETAPISDLDIRFPIYAYVDQHIFEIARKMLHHEVRLLAVTDRNGEYIGIIEKRDVLESLSNMLNITTSGSVITVHMLRSDFTLAKLVHLIESEGAKILGLTVEQPNNNDVMIQVSLKLSHEDTSAIVSSLERHGYIAVTENRDDILQIDLTTRADELMRYLEL
ncbi:MAG: CBS domain-containing protein [Balneolaceae bacterium]|nr:MAG: CBS domain-containing protein [Balneolaceae bacterium]